MLELLFISIKKFSYGNNHLKTKSFEILNFVNLPKEKIYFNYFDKKILVGNIYSIN